MRRAVAILVLFAVAMIVPVISIAGACGPKPPCCRTTPAETSSISRSACCVPEACAATTREARDGNTVQQTQRDSAQLVALASPLALAPVAAPTVSPLWQEPLPAPDIHRRLASFSLLLI